MFDITVIICSHNPRKEFLDRTLGALKLQSLEFEKWQLLLIDNNSDNDLSQFFDLSWHPNGNHIIEKKIGLTNARLVGIEEADGKLLVFVDDDNELDGDYLEKSMNIASNYPEIGVFGGILVGDFEIPPPDLKTPYLSWLAVRGLDRNVWSNTYGWETTPSGAGMVMKREIAEQYALNTKNNPVKKFLGRTANNTISGEDGDMAYTGIDMGYGCGRFTELKLVHIIPKERLEEEYLFKLYQGIVASRIILESFRDTNFKFTKDNHIKLMLKKVYLKIFSTKENYKIEKARLKGYYQAKVILSKIKNV